MRFRLLRSTLLVLACLGMVTSPIVAAEPIFSVSQPKAKLVLDVSLSKNGELAGEVWNSSGHAQIATDVVLWKGSEQIDRTFTDADGRFRFNGLRGGLYRIAAPSNSITCRAWIAGVAPQVRVKV